MNIAAQLPDPLSTPLEQIDVSDPRLYQQDAWRPYFERLRNEDPVHYQAESPFGPFWSVTRFDDIVAVDSNHQVFSSEPSIILGDLGDRIPAEMFIAMDPPKQFQNFGPLLWYLGMVSADERKVFDGYEAQIARHNRREIAAQTPCARSVASPHFQNIAQPCGGDHADARAFALQQGICACGCTVNHN